MMNETNGEVPMVLIDNNKAVYEGKDIFGHKFR